MTDDAPVASEPVDDEPDPPVDDDPVDDEVVSDDVVHDDGDDAAAGSPAEADTAPVEPATVEALIADVERLTAERDKHLEDAQRLAAEFANFRKQTDRRHAEMADQAGAGLVERLLPVLDACDSAVAQGADDVAPIREMFRELLGREGLEVIDAVDVPFDPNLHEAVMRSDGDPDNQVVAEVLRTGYVLRGRVLRAAMVRVSG